MAQLNPGDREALETGAAAFAAAGALPDSAAWQAGWPTPGSPAPADLDTDRRR